MYDSESVIINSAFISIFVFFLFQLSQKCLECIQPQLNFLDYSGEKKKIKWLTERKLNKTIFYSQKLVIIKMYQLFNSEIDKKLKKNIDREKNSHK